MLQRLLVERIEHRIIVGTVAFLAIMVLVGWIAINEGARMQAFERQYAGRSVERGAALYMTYCSTCHQVDGRGAVGRAPALNSPHLFGHDFLAEQRSEITALEAELNSSTPPTDDRRAEIEARLVELEAEMQPILQQMQPAIDLGYDPAQPSRLARLGWGATLNSFIYTTLVHGRPNSSSYWPEPMPAWSQTAGGQLREDQIEDLTAFILNWDKGDDWTVEDLNAVRQFPIYAVDPSSVTVSDEPRVGTDVAAIEAELANVTGDPVNGQALYNGATFGCIGCHANAAVAPVTAETWQAAQTVRLEDPANAGKTPESYLIESIVNPNAYVVPPYPAGVMPQNFGERMTHQDLADILAYLMSYTGETASAAAAPSGT